MYECATVQRRFVARQIEDGVESRLNVWILMTVLLASVKWNCGGAMLYFTITTTTATPSYWGELLVKVPQLQRWRVNVTSQRVAWIASRANALTSNSQVKSSAHSVHAVRLRCYCCCCCCIYCIYIYRFVMLIVGWRDSLLSSSAISWRPPVASLAARVSSAAGARNNLATQP